MARMAAVARRLTLRRVRWVLVAVAGLALAFLLVPNAWVWAASAGRTADLGAEDDTSSAPVAIVLGASVYASGDPSPWLRYRLDAAAELYESGRVEGILVSGDNAQAEYNEPVTMRDYLVSVGVPSEAIAIDYAGFDTYDTCVRAHDIFGVEQAVLVSQDFHVPRAVAVCRAVGIDATGVGDTRATANRSTWVRSWARERLAAVKAAWDVLSDRTPTMGDQETSVEEAVAWTREQRRGADAQSAATPSAGAAASAGSPATSSATPQAGPSPSGH
ncbi:MAG: ElyC/SanA/YdcF family protein [Actinomyces sp.]|uniref:SanA/YdcF family protein n=1 Tax=Actinomyces sp. TaxID=29317 RepID=UPI0026DDAE85|nr:ElyC/SanA/YdcF family protein [Actinomyces sp.]MDO4242499.1 ElyC/SanA/YdcF family protein [Actinomyces sp.]